MNDNDRLDISEDELLHFAIGDEHDQNLYLGKLHANKDTLNGSILGPSQKDLNNRRYWKVMEDKR